MRSLLPTILAITMCQSTGAVADAINVLDSAKRYLVTIVSGERSKTIGTGVIFDRWFADKIPHITIVTNATVLQGLDAATVTHAGKSYHAKIQIVDRLLNLAVLGIEGTDLTPAPKSTVLNKKPTEGNYPKVYAIRSPWNSESTLSEGTITRTQDSNGLTFIYTTIPMSGGHFGEALFDDAGQLIGVTGFKAGGPAGKEFHVGVAAESIERFREASEWGEIYKIKSEDLGFGEQETVLIQYANLLGRWLLAAQSPRGRLWHQELNEARDNAHRTIMTDDTSRTEMDAALRNEKELLRQALKQFLITQGISSLQSAASPDSVSLSCVASHPEKFLGTVVSIFFSEAKRTVTFNGQQATAVEFDNATIRAGRDNGATYSVSRTTGKFSVAVDGRPMFSGQCEVAATKKF